MWEGNLPIARDCILTSTFVDDDGAFLRITVDAFAVAREPKVDVQRGFILNVTRSSGLLSSTAHAEIYSRSDIFAVPLVRGRATRERIQTQLFERCFNIIAWTTYRHRGKQLINKTRIFIGVAERAEKFLLIVESALSHEETTFSTIDELRGLFSSRDASMDEQFISAQECLVTQFAKRFQSWH